MATNKSAITRYLALDHCFRNPGRNFYIEDLLEACNNALEEEYRDSSGVKKRQIYDDIKYMRRLDRFDAPIESFQDGRRVYYRYSDKNFTISNQPINQQEAEQLKQALVTLSRFKGLPQFEWIEDMKLRLNGVFHLSEENSVIGYDENPELTGLHHLNDIFNAIVNKIVLEIEYEPFNKGHINFVIHPYFLKEFNNRWFLFGLNNKYNTILNIPLDRIIKINTCKINYKQNAEIDFDDYFFDVIGVTIPKNAAPLNVRLKIDIKRWPYINTKPLHHSQKVKSKTDDYIVVELKVIMNPELESMLLYYGEDIEVLEPPELRNRVIGHIQESIRNYNLIDLYSSI